MQDRVPLYPGRVTLTPVSGQANTYDMARADQPSQEGTPLNKGSLLKDSTAALFGLGADAVPDDALALLGKYNQYWWKRRSLDITYPISVATQATTIFSANSSQSPNSVSYSDSVSAGENGVTLVNPSTVAINRGTASDGVTVSNNLFPGKYVTGVVGDSGGKIDGVYLIGDNPSFRFNSSGNPYTNYAYLVTSRTVYQYGDWEYVQSNDRNAYPDSGTSGGYEYQYLGVPFNNTLLPKFALLKEIVTTEAVTGGVLEVDLSDIDFSKYAYVHVDVKMNATTQVYYYINNSTSHCTYGELNINGNSGAISGSECLGSFGDNERYKFAPWISFNVGYNGARFVNCTRHNCLGVNPYVTFSQLQSMQFQCQGTIKVDSVIRVWGEG